MLYHSNGKVGLVEVILSLKKPTKDQDFFSTSMKVVQVTEIAHKRHEDCHIGHESCEDYIKVMKVMSKKSPRP